MKSLKIFIIVLLVHCLHGHSYGQGENKYFRKDYQYVDDYRSYYKVNTIQRTWEAAKHICEQEGAALFYPRDRAEATNIMRYLANVHLFSMIYIGASTMASGKYGTVDDNILPAEFGNIPGAPKGTHNCAVMYRNTSIVGESCRKRYPFICKMSIDTVEWDEKCDLPYKGYVFNEALGKCYKFHLTPMDWSAAYATCKAELSYLTVIDSQAEANHLVRITQAAPKDKVEGSYLRGVIHVGFHNRYNTGWRTIQDVTLTESGFNGWAIGEPNGGDGEKCGSMYYTGQLNDVSCARKCFFVCEHDLNKLSNAIDDRQAAK